MPNNPVPNNKVRQVLLLILKIAVVVVLVWAVRRSFTDALAQLDQQGWSIRQVDPAWFAAGGVLWLAGMFPSGCLWHAIIRRLGYPVHLSDVLRVYYIGHIGKYAPGKALVIILRAGLLARLGVKPLAATLAVFYETLTMMTVGALVAATILFTRAPDRLWLAGAAVALAVPVGVPLLPGVFYWLVRISTMGRIDQSALTPLCNVPFGLVARSWSGIALGWLLIGASLWTALPAAGFATGTPGANDLLLCTAAAGLSLVAGFVSLVPGGLVVREAVLLPILAPIYGEAAALTATLVSRLASIVAEAVVSAILYLTLRRGGGIGAEKA